MTHGLTPCRCRFRRCLRRGLCGTAGNTRTVICLIERIGIHAAVPLGRGRIHERNGLVNTAAQLTETGQTADPVVLQAETNLEDKTVDSGGGLHIRDTVGRQQRTKHTVIVFDKVRKEHRLPGHLHYERT